MPRYVAPDKGVKETVIGGVKYNPDRGGLYNVESRAHGEAMKREGFFEASLKAALRASVSFLSPNGVEVPWAFT